MENWRLINPPWASEVPLEGAPGREADHATLLAPSSTNPKLDSIFGFLTLPPQRHSEMFPSARGMIVSTGIHHMALGFASRREP